MAKLGVLEEVVRVSVVGGLLLSLVAVGGCTVQTGSSVNDASNAPARTRATPKKASPSKTPASTSGPARTPANPTRK